MHVLLFVVSCCVCIACNSLIIVDCALFGDCLSVVFGCLFDVLSVCFIAFAVWLLACLLACCCGLLGLIVVRCLLFHGCWLLVVVAVCCVVFVASCLLCNLRWRELIRQHYS